MDNRPGYKIDNFISHDLSFSKNAEKTGLKVYKKIKEELSIYKEGDSEISNTGTVSKRKLSSFGQSSIGNISNIKNISNEKSSSGNSSMDLCLANKQKIESNLSEKQERSSIEYECYMKHRNSALGYTEKGVRYI